MSNSNEYICECCRETFSKGWSDEEAVAEAKERFGMDPFTDDMAIICDDCYQNHVVLVDKFYREMLSWMRDWAR